MGDPTASADVFAGLSRVAGELASVIRNDLDTRTGDVEAYTNLLLKIKALQRKVRVEMEDWFEASSARTANILEAVTEANMTLGDLGSERVLFSARRMENLRAALQEVADELATAAQTGRHLRGYRPAVLEDNS